MQGKVRRRIVPIYTKNFCCFLVETNNIWLKNLNNFCFIKEKPLTANVNRTENEAKNCYADRKELCIKEKSVSQSVS